MTTLSTTSRAYNDFICAVNFMQGKEYSPIDSIEIMVYEDYDYNDGEFGTDDDSDGQQVDIIIDTEHIPSDIVVRLIFELDAQVTVWGEKQLYFECTHYTFCDLIAKYVD